MINITITITDGDYTETLSLTAEQVEKFQGVTGAIDKTYTETARRVWERGCYDVFYRFTHQAKTYQEFKAYKAAKKAGTL